MENKQKVSIATTLGMLGGVYFAYKKKSSVWGYAGYGFLFSFLAGRVARMFFPINWVSTAQQSNTDKSKPTEAQIRDWIENPPAAGTETDEYWRWYMDSHGVVNPNDRPKQ
jgi:hypothetical protein